jgi:prevent-host-death family protein
MIRVSSTEFGKEVGRYQDVALSQPVIVTRNGRDRTVMISAEEYRRLKISRKPMPRRCARRSLRRQRRRSTMS